MVGCEKEAGMKKGFTLVEMLVVVAILGILMAMMIPAAGLIVKRAKISTARGDAGVAGTVLLRYQSEYNRWPGIMAGKDRTYTDVEWVATMSPAPGGALDPNNMKKVKFFEPGAGALGTVEPNVGAFVDPWGNPFEYKVDADRNEEIPDPETDTVVRARVLAWSAGPDGDYDTWDDNVKGWE